jgi:hypothetical protein
LHFSLTAITEIANRSASFGSTSSAVESLIIQKLLKIKDFNINIPFKS